MVNQGIVLGHVISRRGIEVDKAKIELISKLPSPTNVKTVRQLLGHTGFIGDLLRTFRRLLSPSISCLRKTLNFLGIKTIRRALKS